MVVVVVRESGGSGVREGEVGGKAERSRGWRESVSVTLSHMAESPL